MADFVHRHWLDWAFWTMISGYVLFAPAIFWRPAWVVAVALVVCACLITFVGFAFDNVVYRRMKREQERQI